MRKASRYEILLLRVAIWKRDGVSVVGVIFEDPDSDWETAIDGLPPDEKAFVEESLRSYEQKLDQEGCSGL